MSSLWMATSVAPHYPVLDHELHVDVAVLGGGIAGLTTALLCQRAGLNVAVIDAGRIAAGVTGSTTGKITALQEPVYHGLVSRYGPHVAGRYAQGNLSAVETIAGLVDELEIDCSFERRPAYIYTADAEKAGDLRAEAEAARQAGLDVAETTDTGLPFEVAAAIKLDDQAQFHARSYCLALANALIRGGGSIFETTPATGVHDGDPCRVRTPHAEIEAGNVVVATHAPFLYRGLYFAKTRPSRSYAVAAPYEAVPPPGMYISADQPLRSLRSHTQGADTWLIIGGESHKTGQDGDASKRYAALREWGSAHFGVDAFEFEWSAQDLMPADDLPYIGSLAATTKHTWVATGFRKWGMTNATLAAEILTARISGGSHPLEDAFEPRRHPAAMLKRMAGEVADTAKHFVADRLAGSGEPAPGEGAVIRRDGERIAVYVSETGERFEVSAVCTHLGCLVAWNDAERTWDCPCHGSRFEIDGAVLEGPAVEPLHRVDRERAS